jgi:hypothetical protein
MKSLRARALTWLAVTLVSFWSLPTLADESGRSTVIQRTAVPGDKLFLERPDGTQLSGSFQGLGESDTAILLRVFDLGDSRFTTDVIPLQEISSLVRVRSSRSDAYPLLAGLAGGTVGAVSGYMLGDDGWSGGDVQTSDTRPALAIGLGLAGAFLGFILGAILAPRQEMRVVLW